MSSWQIFWQSFWATLRDDLSMGPVRRWLKRLPVMISGWRWHFRMSRYGQWVLKLAHGPNTPIWLHDVIERIVYEDRGGR